MGNSNGAHAGKNGNGTTKSPPSEPISTVANSAAAIEYYILCPQRETEVPGLITHLISRDICDKRQCENYHKCPNCVRSRISRERNGLPAEVTLAAH